MEILNFATLFAIDYRAYINILAKFTVMSNDQNLSSYEVAYQ